MNNPYSANKIPLSPTMGLEINDFQLSNIDNKTSSEIYADLLKHKLLVFRDQEHTERFEGMTVEESRPIIDFICAHIAKYEFTMRVRWAKNTIVIWDNRSLQHHAVNDYNGHLRIMHRIIMRDKQSVLTSLQQVG